MKKQLIIGILGLNLLILGACANGYQSNDSSSANTETSSQRSQFKKETDKIVSASNGEVLGITVTAQDGFDSLKVKMNKDLSEKSAKEQLATCQKYQAKLITAYQNYYVKENSGEHKPVTNYFSDGKAIVMSQREQDDPEKLVNVD